MQRHQTWTLALLGSAILALLLLAWGISGLRFQPGHFYAVNIQPLLPSSPGDPLRAPSPTTLWQRLAALISLALLLYLLIRLILSKQLRRELLRRIMILFTGVLLIYLMISALRGVPRPLEIGGQLTSGAAPAQLDFGEAFPTFVARPAPWLVIAISVLVAALLIGAVWLIWRRTRAQKPALQQLADEAQAALTELEAGGDLANTVLRCYREMSRVLSEQRGIARQRDVTPREFERQLAAAGLRDEHIQQLTRLFERVRYGPQRADPQQERAAVACLAAIVRTYGAAP